MTAVKRFGWLPLLLCVALVLWALIDPKTPSKETLQSCVTVKMDRGKIYTHQNRRIEVKDGAVVIEDENRKEVVACTDFYAPSMTVCEGYIAIFEYPETCFFLCELSTGRRVKVETQTAISAMRLSREGFALAICDRVSTVFLYSPSGELKLTVESDWPICDATLSDNGKKMGVLLFSGKRENGYVVEVFRTKNGARLYTVAFTHEELLSCHVENGRMYLSDHGEAVGYVRRGKFHLFGKTP